MQLLSAHCSSQPYLINLHFEGCLGSFNFKKDQGCGLLVYSDKGDLLIIISRSKWSSKTYMKLKVALVVSLKNFLTWEKQGLEPGLCSQMHLGTSPVFTCVSSARHQLLVFSVENRNATHIIWAL